MVSLSLSLAHRVLFYAQIMHFTQSELKKRKENDFLTHYVRIGTTIHPSILLNK